jgi:JAB1/Mov34/MPN/PAD-1 ubiquitin protease
MESVPAMNSTALDAVSEVWQAVGCAVRIDYSRAVMEELGLAASDGFNRLAKGGVEIGGVLFGVRDSDAVKILAYRALACEYAFGPSFTLSDNDRRVLEDLLTSPNTDSSLSGMRPVGWYHSHTRSDILLSEEDLQLFQQYFPETWQIALVLRPHRFGPVRAGFFFRESDGSVQAAASRHEFIIKPGLDKPGMRLPDDPALAEPALSEPCPQSSAISSPGSEPEPRWSPPRGTSSYPSRPWSWRAAAIAVTLAVVLFWTARFRVSAGLSLHELDAGGHLRIDWNHNARIIQQGESGALEIEDGSLKLHHELSQEHLRLGSATYLRTSGNVLVRLLVRDAGQSTFSEITRFLGPPVAVAAPIDIGPADPSARKDGTVPRPGRREREREVRYAQPVDRPSHQIPREGPVRADSARQTTAASALKHRQLILPHARFPRPEAPLLPAPPVIAPNTAAAMATYIPHLPIPAPLNPVDQGLAAGKIIWTGKLPRSGTIQILGNRASQGRVTGGLPGIPVRVQVFPSELIQEGLRIFTADPLSISPPEAPGAQNGWNRTVYVLNAKKAGEISILEAPGQQNAWNRLVLRAERGDHSIIVLRWERVPVESARYSRGNQ